METVYLEELCNIKSMMKKVKNGVHKEYYPNGDIRVKTNYVNWKKHGKETHYDKSGIKSERFYKNGKLTKYQEVLEESFSNKEQEVKNEISKKPPIDSLKTLPKSKESVGPIPEITMSEFKDNENCITYKRLFKKYLKGAKKITIIDSYIRESYQVSNLKEFIYIVLQVKSEGEDINVDLLTTEDNTEPKQEDDLNSIKDFCRDRGIDFNWKYDKNNSIHARRIILDNGWEIILERGLDIYMNNYTYNIKEKEVIPQNRRRIKGFYVFYIHKPRIS